jgi:hypothetical protein
MGLTVFFCFTGLVIQRLMEGIAVRKLETMWKVEVVPLLAIKY